MKPKFWKDLLTDEPFSRKDIIHLQDPMNLSGRNMEQFDHVKKKLRLISEEEEAKLRVSAIALFLFNKAGRGWRVLLHVPCTSSYEGQHCSEHRNPCPPNAAGVMAGQCCCTLMETRCVMVHNDHSGESGVHPQVPER